MNKVFCVSCGFKILYEVSKPKFCSSCGKGVGSISSASNKEQEEEVEASQLEIDVDKLSKDIVIEKDESKSSLKDLWSSVTPAEANRGVGGREEFSRAASKDPEGQELLDKLRKDCGSSRQRDIDE